MPICRRPVANGFRSVEGLYSIRSAGGSHVHLPGSAGGKTREHRAVAVVNNVDETALAARLAAINPLGSTHSMISIYIRHSLNFQCFQYSTVAAHVTPRYRTMVRLRNSGSFIFSGLFSFQLSQTW